MLGNSMSTEKLPNDSDGTGTNSPSANSGDADIVQKQKRLGKDFDAIVSPFLKLVGKVLALLIPTVLALANANFAQIVALLAAIAIVGFWYRRWRQEVDCSLRDQERI